MPGDERFRQPFQGNVRRVALHYPGSSSSEPRAGPLLRSGGALPGYATPARQQPDDQPEGDQRAGQHAEAGQ